MFLGPLSEQNDGQGGLAAAKIFSISDEIMTLNRNMYKHHWIIYHSVPITQIRLDKNGKGYSKLFEYTLVNEQDYIVYGCEVNHILSTLNIYESNLFHCISYLR